MEFWIVFLGSACCLYTAREIVRLSRPAPAPRRAQFGTSPVQPVATDARTGRPLDFRRDRRRTGRRRDDPGSEGAGPRRSETLGREEAEARWSEA